MGNEDLLNMHYLVDGEGPFNAVEILRQNVTDGKAPSANRTDVIALLSMPPGEVYTIGNLIDIKRVK